MESRGTAGENARVLSTAAACPGCGGEERYAFLEIDGLPVHIGVQWETRDEARACPRGHIRLVFCGSCGLIFNEAFDPGLPLYGPRYENRLSCSPRFMDYARALALRLIERHGVRGKRVVEIGCGRGEFLSLLCELGGNEGLGFDPGHAGPLLGDEGRGRFRVIGEEYSDRRAGPPADLVCARHVLEHVPDPATFVRGMRSALGDRPEGTAYAEVPDALHVLRDLSVWDIIYEHFSYWTAPSLARLFERCGFYVCDTSREFGGQYLGIEAKPGSAGSRREAEDLDGLARQVDEFPQRFEERVSGWRRRLADLAAGGRRIVVWGAGAKGVGFLNLADLQCRIGYVVDINPHKQGLFIAGTGQEIVPPAFLQDRPPDAVLVTNGLYEDEIAATLDELGVAARLVAI